MVHGTWGSPCLPGCSRGQDFGVHRASLGARQLVTQAPSQLVEASKRPSHGLSSTPVPSVMSAENSTCRMHVILPRAVRRILLLSNDSCSSIVGEIHQIPRVEVDQWALSKCLSNVLLPALRELSPVSTKLDPNMEDRSIFHKPFRLLKLAHPGTSTKVKPISRRGLVW